MRKKVLMVMLGLAIILASSTVVSATTNRMRVLGNGGLVGIVSDEAIDIELNSAQLFNIKENKFFLDSQLRIDDLNDRILISPRVVYHLDNNNVSGIYADIDSRENFDMYSFKVANAIQYNQQLTLGGRLGLNSLESENEVVFAGGFIYEPNAKVVIDGSLGMNYGYKFNNISEIATSLFNFSGNFPGLDEYLDNEVANVPVVSEDNPRLFLRRVEEINEDESIVGLIDLNFGDSDILNNQKIAIGKNSKYKNSLFSYGARLLNSDLYTSLDLNWGIENNLKDNLVLRVGSSHNILMDIDDETEISTPQGDYVNVGLSYKYDAKTKLDIAYLPYVQLGDDTTTDINISLTRTF